jgi:hypothetical protein
MQEKHSGETNQSRSNLDERLSAYYGPALPEQPLSLSSWSRLSVQLGSQRHQRTFHIAHTRIPRLFKVSTDRLPPLYIQSAYSRIASEAGFHHVPRMLTCRFDMRLRTPELRVSLLSRRHIHLRLPLSARESMVPSALDVLLATGLARYIQKRKSTYLIQRLLLVGAMFIILTACILVLVFTKEGNAPVIFPIAIGLCILLEVLSGWGLRSQSRRLAVLADELMVVWLGRSQVCQGLHALADLSRAPSRRRWGDLSLTERIDHVCGTHVPAHEDRFTLVR